MNKTIEEIKAELNLEAKLRDEEYEASLTVIPEGNDNYRTIVEEYRNLRDQEKEIKARKDEINKIIKALFEDGTNTLVTSDGEILAKLQHRAASVSVNREEVQSRFPIEQFPQFWKTGNPSVALIID